MTHDIFFVSKCDMFGWFLKCINLFNPAFERFNISCVDMLKDAKYCIY